MRAFFNLKIFVCVLVLSFHFLVLHKLKIDVEVVFSPVVSSTIFIMKEGEGGYRFVFLFIRSIESVKEL